MRYNLIILIGLSYIFISFKLLPQTLSVQETIDYINEKLNMDGNKDSDDKNASYEWSVTKDGKLIIKRFKNKELWSETSVYLKQLDTSLVQVYREQGNPRVFGLIKIYSKTDNGITKRFLKTEDSDEKIVHFFMENISFNADQVLTNQLKKAIDHLVILSKNRKDYRDKDPFGE